MTTRYCIISHEVTQTVLFCCSVGEGRAYWSLGNAHTALGNHEQAMQFAEKHLEIAKEVTVYSFPALLGVLSGHTSICWLSREQQEIIAYVFVKPDVEIEIYRMLTVNCNVVIGADRR